MANFLTSKLSGISELFTSSKKVGHPRRRPMKEDLGDHVIIGPAVDGNGDVPTTTPTAPTETVRVVFFSLFYGEYSDLVQLKCCVSENSGHYTQF